MNTPQSIQQAALQLLEHWNRCGVRSLPIGSAENVQGWTSTSQATQSHKPVANELSNLAAPPVSTVAPDNKEPLPLPPLRSETSLISRLKPATSTSASAAGNSTSASAGDLAAEISNTPPLKWIAPSLPLENRSTIFQDLSEQVSVCKRCVQLACTRKKAVFGVGKLQPRVVFFGEAPGADEDATGIPFVGRAGQLLDKIIVASQMRREDVYILNSIKCRPPNNRLPSDSEMENCKPFFEQQLEILQPEYIVCLGAVAVRSVLNTTAPVGRLRGKFHSYKGARVMVTYHPSYLLRNEDAKRFTWEDMQMLMKAMGLTIPGKK